MFTWRDRFFVVSILSFAVVIDVITQLELTQDDVVAFNADGFVAIFFFFQKLSYFLLIV